jgi:glutathione synthase/RimK-type ligase-like ATP-grasp enzyme
MAKMGLVYAALDFVVDPDGVWTFLEINAGGQFGWIEDETGAPLTAQLTDLLAKGQP